MTTSRATEPLDGHPAATPAAAEALRAVLTERLRQEQLWNPTGQHGRWPHSPAEKMSILAEEVGEIAQAVNDGDADGARIEIVQVAAVALRWLESFDEDAFRPLSG